MSDAPANTLYLSPADAALFAQKYGHPRVDMVTVGDPYVVYTRAQSPAAPQVSVKVLVWEENPDKGECGLLAHSVIGTYHATCDGWSIHRTMRWEDADTIDAAKAAAQADYESRIVSAIDTTPVSVMDDPRVQRLVEAANWAVFHIKDYLADDGGTLPLEEATDGLTTALAAISEPAP